MKNIIKVAVLAGGIAAVSFGASAMDDPVKSRQELMKGVGASIGLTVKMIKGAEEFDAAKAEAALKSISAAAEKFPEFFKDGTDMTKVPTSEASPKIWENMDDFKKKSDNLKTASLKAAEVAKGGKEALAGVIKSVTDTCGACHQDYRVKKN